MLVRLFCQRHPHYYSSSTVRPFLFGSQQNLLSTNFTLPKRTLTVSVMSAVFSAGEDEAKMKEELQSLQETGWILDEDCMGIKKTYYFKTYTKVLVRTPLFILFNFILISFSAICICNSPRSLDFCGTLTLRSLIEQSQDFHMVIGVRCKSKYHHPKMETVSISLWRHLLPCSPCFLFNSN
jgi:pterin-4a-carbinolamine dehydratase